MSFFDKFRKPKPAPAPNPPQDSLPGLCWVIAYFILPHYAFKDCDKLVKLFVESPETAGPFFYFMACQAQKIEPTKENGLRFRIHQGQFDGANDYYALEYPKPPLVDLSHADPANIPPDQMPVLAPYFSVVVR